MKGIIERKKFFSVLLLAVCVFLVPQRAQAYKILYAEQWYRLYHDHFHRYPEDTLENIYYLERALKSDFCNPLNALARITDKKEWERYRNLFSMHVNLKLTELYLTLGSKYDKRNAFFYNYPWKWSNLQSLDKAEQIYQTAYYYWEEAKKWAAKVPYSFVQIEDIQYWEDENYRIHTGELNYREIISAQLDRLRKVRQEFQQMNGTTY